MHRSGKGLAAILSQDLDQHPVANDRNLLGEVPVIDVASLFCATDAGVIAARPVVDDIARACRDWGFFQVVNHGVSPELVDDVQREMRRFSSCPISASRRSCAHAKIPGATTTTN
jgi:hypothetical protein